MWLLEMKRNVPFFPWKWKKNLALFVLGDATLFSKIWPVNLFEKGMKTKPWTSCRKQKEMVFIFLKSLINKLANWENTYWDKFPNW